jgi:serine/threonine protein kinase
MPSVLAIISRAVFEKMAPKRVAVGDLVETDRYVSRQRTFDTLADGGALFLVTVRPPDEPLWLFAIVERPRSDEQGWVGEPNRVPITDVTSAIGRLTFATGQGLKTKKGTLGMSLQTPRVLTDADERLLRELAGGAAPPPPADHDRPVSPRAHTVDLTPAKDPLLGKALGHYRVVAHLGEGGMGIVYRAEDEKLRRAVAIKVLPDASGSEERRQRFLREARSAAAISHPNVAVIHQVDEVDGQAYIAMELVEGENLRARLRKGRLDVATARDLAGQMARGLAAAHEKGIVHRDLKPENVMITPAGLVKLLDFGLAKATSSPSVTAEAALARTETAVTSDEGRVMGTPGYMSPEQALGQPLDVRSDVFSLGIVLYEMFSGVRPFAGTTTGELLVAIARDDPAPLREKAPETDEALAAVVVRCLAKAPADRFAHAGEVASALALAAASGAVVASTAPAVPRTPTKRSPLPAVAAVVVLVAASVAGAVALSERSASPGIVATPSATVVPAAAPPLTKVPDAAIE